MITQSVHSYISLPSSLLEQLSNFIHTWHMDEDVKDKTFRQVLCLGKGKRTELVLSEGSSHGAWLGPAARWPPAPACVHWQGNHCPRSLASATLCAVTCPAIQAKVLEQSWDISYVLQKTSFFLQKRVGIPASKSTQQDKINQTSALPKSYK